MISFPSISGVDGVEIGQGNRRELLRLENQQQTNYRTRMHRQAADPASGEVKKRLPAATGDRRDKWIQDVK